MQVILRTLLLAVLLNQLHAAAVVASLTFPTPDDQLGNIYAQETSTFGQDFNLTITSSSANTGDSGYLVFQTQMQIAYNGSYEPYESLEGSGYLQINDQPALQAPYYNPTNFCTAYYDEHCSVAFTFGVPFTVRLQAKAEVDYTLRHGAVQNLHGASSSILITPQVFLNTIVPAQPIDANIDSENAAFFTQSPTYRNAVFTLPTETPVSVSDVPEPASAGLMIVGVGALAMWKRKPARS